MVTWLKKHSRGLNFFGGIFILLITMLLYFWTTTQSEVVATTGKSAQEKRMDRSVRGHSNIITRKSQKSKDMSVFSKKLKNSKQAENFLLFLMILGFGMVLYSLYSKYKEQKKLS